MFFFFRRKRQTGEEEKQKVKSQHQQRSTHARAYATIAPRRSREKSELGVGCAEQSYKDVSPPRVGRDAGTSPPFCTPVIITFFFFCLLVCLYVCIKKKKKLSRKP